MEDKILLTNGLTDFNADEFQKKEETTVNEEESNLRMEEVVEGKEKNSSSLLTKCSKSQTNNASSTTENIEADPKIASGTVFNNTLFFDNLKVRSQEVAHGIPVIRKPISEVKPTPKIRTTIKDDYKQCEGKEKQEIEPIENIKGEEDEKYKQQEEIESQSEIEKKTDRGGTEEGIWQEAIKLPFEAERIENVKSEEEEKDKEQEDIERQLETERIEKFLRENEEERKRQKEITRRIEIEEKTKREEEEWRELQEKIKLQIETERKIKREEEEEHKRQEEIKRQIEIEEKIKREEEEWRERQEKIKRQIEIEEKIKREEEEWRELQEKIKLQIETERKIKREEEQEHKRQEEIKRQIENEEKIKREEEEERKLQEKLKCQLEVENKREEARRLIRLEKIKDHLITKPSTPPPSSPSPSLSPSLSPSTSRPPLPRHRSPVSSSEINKNVLIMTHPSSKKILNILVLGQTGVGKSTWINAFANYTTFYTIEEAVNAPEPICLIPSKFSFNGQEVTLNPPNGGNDQNEVLAHGESSTQNPKTYQFKTPKYTINIIDTPGIGDTRGPEQDKKNLVKILNAISSYKELHGICFLFKANEARLTPDFRFRISELLLQLHKDAINNIAFFFTNARGSFYRPGDTTAPLKKFFTDLANKRNILINLGEEKEFCVDNEAFRLVCIRHNGIHFTEEELKDYARSWEKSASETHRFIEYIANLNPHRVKDTISINKARKIILFLAKPLADVNELIESNIKVANDRKKDLENTANNLAELKKKSEIPQINIQVEPLDYPKMVCAGKNCIKTQRIGNSEQFQTIYEQTCHEICLLPDVNPEKIPEPNIEFCDVMSNGICRMCKCSWKVHMHIKFNQIKTAIAIEDPNIKNSIFTNENATLTKQKMIKDCEERINELKEEQNKIIKTSLRFGSFLQANAILSYNDAFEQYVEQTIQQNENCVSMGSDFIKSQNLKRLLDEYKQEKKLMEIAAEKANNKSSKKIDADDIKRLKKDLFTLKHTGKTLKTLFKATDQGVSKHNAHVTVKYPPPGPKKPWIWSRFFPSR